MSIKQLENFKGKLQIAKDFKTKYQYQCARSYDCGKKLYDNKLTHKKVLLMNMNHYVNYIKSGLNQVDYINENNIKSKRIEARNLSFGKYALQGYFGFHIKHYDKKLFNEKIRNFNLVG